MRQLDLFAHTLAPEPTTAPAIPVSMELDTFALVGDIIQEFFLSFRASP